MNHAQLTTIANEMRAELPLVGRVERVVTNGSAGPIYLRLMARFERVQLYVGYRDSYPDPEQAAQIAAHFGAAAATDFIREPVIVASQDGIYRKVPCLIFGWYESTRVRPN